MKVAITTKGEDLNSEIDLRFGRCKNILIIDTETNEFELLDNKLNLQAAQGAGIQTAQNVAEAKVTVLISGHCGPNAFKALNAADITIYNVEGGTVKDVLVKLKENKLTQASKADVEGHW